METNPYWEEDRTSLGFLFTLALAMLKKVRALEELVGRGNPELLAKFQAEWDELNVDVEAWDMLMGTIVMKNDRFREGSGGE